jgi:hypothetical protein
MIITRRMGLLPKFTTLLELKHWLKEYSVKHYHPYTVVHSDMKKRYTIKCEEDGCTWVVRARPLKGGPDWHKQSLRMLQVGDVM